MSLGPWTGRTRLLAACLEVAHGGFADRARARVGDRALHRPAGDRDEVEQLPRDRAEAEARADDAGELRAARRAVRSMSRRGRARSGARAASGSASGSAGRRPGRRPRPRSTPFCFENVSIRCSQTAGRSTGSRAARACRSRRGGARRAWAISSTGNPCPGGTWTRFVGEHVRDDSRLGDARRSGHLRREAARSRSSSGGADPDERRRTLGPLLDHGRRVAALRAARAARSGTSSRAPATRERPRVADAAPELARGREERPRG